MKKDVHNVNTTDWEEENYSTNTHSFWANNFIFWLPVSTFKNLQLGQMIFHFASNF